MQERENINSASDFSKPQRLRQLLPGFTTGLKNRIETARSFKSPMTDQELIEMEISERLNSDNFDIIIGSSEFYQGEFAEIVESLIKYGRLIFDGVNNKIGSEDGKMDEYYEILSQAYEFAAYKDFLEIKDPDRIEIIDFEEDIDTDSYYSYLATDDEREKMDEESEREVNLANLNDEEEYIHIKSRQVQYFYNTDLPGVELVFQFSSKQDKDKYNEFISKNHEGENYQEPRYLNGLHSIYLKVGREAYLESLKEL